MLNTSFLLLGGQCKEPVGQLELAPLAAILFHAAFSHLCSLK